MRHALSTQKINSKKLECGPCEYDVDLTLEVIQTSDEGFIASINGIDTVEYTDRECVEEMLHTWAWELVQMGEIEPKKKSSNKLKWVNEDGLHRLYRGTEGLNTTVVPSPFSIGWAIFVHGSLTVDGIKVLTRAKKMAKAMN